MFNQQDLQTLNKIQTKTLTLSLYLNTDQKKYTPQEIKTNLINLLKKAEDVFGKEFNKFLRWRFRLRLKNNVRSLVFFANIRENIFYEYELPRAVESAIYFEKNLHLTPLVKILDEFERYLVAVFDKSKARIFSVYLGEIEEEKSIKQDFSGKHDMGGWSQARYQRHIEDHVRRNLKKVKEIIDAMSRKYEFDRIILAGTLEALSLFKKILPQELRKKIAGEFKSELFAASTKILAQVLKIEEKIERQKEKEKISMWQRFLGKKDKSCSGLKNVVNAACQKRILELLLDVNLKKVGFRCFACGNLLLYQKRICPICNMDEIEKADLIDELVQKVLEQNGGVEFVVDDPLLKKLGGVGARLRY